LRQRYREALGRDVALKKFVKNVHVHSCGVGMHKCESGHVPEKYGNKTWNRHQFSPNRRTLVVFACIERRL
jgi:hypothetical protein